MRSDSNKYISGMNVHKSTFNIKPFKKIEEFKSKVSCSEEGWKKLIITSTFPLKKDQKIP